MKHWVLVTCETKGCPALQMVMAGKCPQDNHQLCVIKVTCRSCERECTIITEMRKAT